MKIFSLITLFFSLSSFATVKLSGWEVCLDQIKCHPIRLGEDLYNKFGHISPKVKYFNKFQLDKGTKCREAQDCWLSLGEIADNAEISLNNKKISSFGKNAYLRHQSILIPLPSAFIKNNNILEVIVTDKDQNLFGLRGEAAYIGTRDDLQLNSIKSWLKGTGTTLACALTMFLLFLGLSASFLLTKKKDVLYLALFSASASLYLISFSEFPRQFFNPVIMSGPVHFSLLLSQASTLFIAVAALFSYKEFAKLNNRVLLLYVGLISMNIVLYFLGENRFSIYKRLILLAAPLISFPYLMMLVWSKRIKDEKERAIVKYSSLIFSLLIINDILVFWQVYRFTFTIKWVQPLVSITLVWVLLRRKFLLDREKAKDLVIGKASRQFAHDIKVDIQCLRMWLQRIKTKLSHEEVNEAYFALDNFYQSIDNVGSRHRTIEVINVGQFLEGQKTRLKDYLAKNNLNLKLNKGKDWCEIKVKQDRTFIRAILHNLIKNAHEASATKIEVTPSSFNGYAKIIISDNGRGIPSEYLEKIFERFFSTKDKMEGQGIGLSHIKEELHSVGGDIEVTSIVNKGTVFSVYIPLAGEPMEFKKSSKEDVQMVLLDDNFLVRSNWEMLASTSNISIMTYATSNDLFDELDNFDRDIELNIDFNLDEKITGVDVAKILYSKGFRNIYLCTEEQVKVENLFYIKGVRGKDHLSNAIISSKKSTERESKPKLSAKRDSRKFCTL